MNLISEETVRNIEITLFNFFKPFLKSPIFPCTAIGLHQAKVSNPNDRTYIIIGLDYFKEDLVTNNRFVKDTIEVIKYLLTEEEIYWSGNKIIFLGEINEPCKIETIIK